MSICETCNGRGQTKQTATIVVKSGKKYVTKLLGYGCLDCQGRGIHGERRVYGKG